MNIPNNNYLLIIAGITALATGLYFWAQDGFPIPWGSIFTVANNHSFLREPGVPIDSYMLLLPLGIGLLIYAYIEIMINKK